MIYIKAENPTQENRFAAIRKGYDESATTKYIADDLENGWLRVSDNDLQFFPEEIQSSAVDIQPEESKIQSATPYTPTEENT